MKRGAKGVECGGVRRGNRSKEKEGSEKRTEAKDEKEKRQQVEEGKLERKREWEGRDEKRRKNTEVVRSKERKKGGRGRL